jgi:hypothetical protein
MARCTVAWRRELDWRTKDGPFQKELTEEILHIGPYDSATKGFPLFMAKYKICRSPRGKRFFGIRIHKCLKSWIEFNLNVLIVLISSLQG